VGAVHGDRRYDVIVAGLGIMGASALSHLARAGAKVIGIDQFSPPHEHGSSHGQTRLLRVAYAEAPAYVPMAQRAVSLWRALEERRDEALFTQSGVLYGGPPDVEWLLGLQRSAQLHGLAIEDGDGSRFHLPSDWRVVLEPGAGFLKAEESVAAFLADAKAHGAKVATGARIAAIEDAGAAIQVRTDSGDFTAPRVVMALGAWSPRMLPFLSRLLRLEQRVLHWYEAGAGFDLASGFVPFVLSPRSDQVLYGNPRIAGEVKLAQHYCGSPLASPAELGRAIAPHELSHVEALVRTYIPALGARRRVKPCMYMLTPDENFILDEHPAIPGLFFLAGLSGHGFKFAPVLGEALANLALGLAQQIDVKFFALDRRALA